MPELPEVETVMRGLNSVLKRATIRKIDIWQKNLRQPIPDNFREIIEKRTVTSIKRRGKYLLFFLDDGKGFGLHLGMSGRIRIFQPADRHKREKHDHIRFITASGAQIVFNDPRRFGTIFLVNEKDWRKHSAFVFMGPEPLDKKFGSEILMSRLQKSRVPIKAALLDQRIVAGVGNIYACEALFESGISPFRLSLSLTKKEFKKLAVAIPSVLRKAIAQGGSTLKDYKKTDGSLGYFQHHFSVYDREGKACTGCICDPEKTGGVTRITQAGRSTFYCPRKQE